MGCVRADGAVIRDGRHIRQMSTARAAEMLPVALRNVSSGFHDGTRPATTRDMKAVMELFPGVGGELQGAIP